MSKIVKTNTEEFERTLVKSHKAAIDRIIELEEELDKTKKQNDILEKARVYDLLWSWYHQIRVEENICSCDDMSDRLEIKCKSEDLYGESNLFAIIENYLVARKYFKK